MFDTEIIDVVNWESFEFPGYARKFGKSVDKRVKRIFDEKEEKWKKNDREKYINA